LAAVVVISIRVLCALRQAWAQHASKYVSASYLRLFELRELTFKISDFVVRVVSCHVLPV
jgi:hypothetical protein